MAESPTPFAEIDLGPSKLDQFLDAHQKKLIGLAILIAIGVIAYVIYSGIAKGEAEDAGAALLTAKKVEDYQKVIDQWPTSNAAASALPLMAEAQGTESPEQAIETLRSFLDSNPDHPATSTAKVSLALRLLEQGNTADATTILTEVADSDSSYITPLACICLGDIAKQAGKKEEAKTWYEKAKEDPTEQGNTYSDAAEARLQLVNALPPTKIKPAPKAPPAPPVTPTTPTVPATPAVTPAPVAPAPVTPAAPVAPTTKEEPATEPTEQKSESSTPEAP